MLNVDKQKHASRVRSDVSVNVQTGWNLGSGNVETYLCGFGYVVIVAAVRYESINDRPWLENYKFRKLVHQQMHFHTDFVILPQASDWALHT